MIEVQASERTPNSTSGTQFVLKYASFPKAQIKNCADDLFLNWANTTIKINEFIDGDQCCNDNEMDSCAEYNIS